MDDSLLNRMWYASFCINEEIDRILNPLTAKDYLLKKRADFVADNSRYVRVYIHKRRMPTYKSFEDSFSDKHYLAFLNKLSREDSEKCDNIAYGDVFFKELDAYIEATKYGPVVCLNQSYHFFLYFINLALLEFDKNVPLHVRLNAIRIAIRIYMQNEAMDFEFDPRGIVPKEIDGIIQNTVFLEKQFIAGHEFSHSLCGHLTEASERKIYTFGDKFKLEKIYNIDQEQEFEADLFAILKPNYSTQERRNVISASLLLMASLSLVEYVHELFYPGQVSSFTHPKAMDRFYRIRDYFVENGEISENEFDGLVKCVDSYKKFIKNDLDSHLDEYEKYGSFYLDEPNTEWRGRKLIDRVDY